LSENPLAITTPGKSNKTTDNNILRHGFRVLRMIASFGLLLGVASGLADRLPDMHYRQRNQLCPIFQRGALL